MNPIYERTYDFREDVQFLYGKLFQPFFNWIKDLRNRESIIRICRSKGDYLFKSVFPDKLLSDVCTKSDKEFPIEFGVYLYEDNPEFDYMNSLVKFGINKKVILYYVLSGSTLKP